MKTDKLTENLLAFRDARDWQQFHNPKDLALSLSIEAAELLECFQWKSAEVAVEVNKEKIIEELADVAIYLKLMAHELDVDLDEAVRLKIISNEKKYPVEKSKGNSNKYTEFQ